jgi:hypothetical protein
VRYPARPVGIPEGAASGKLDDVLGLALNVKWACGNLATHIPLKFIDYSLADDEKCHIVKPVYHRLSMCQA